jgi:signal transduction histidine kinase/ligand-binding sensor domain-containing protein
VIKRLAILPSVLLALSPGVFALDPTLDVNQYAHTSWKYRDGFTKGEILDVAQTADGYLWLATEFALLRFDGVKPVPWEPPPDQPLPSNNVRKLFAAPDGALWISTGNGLASWKDGKVTQYPELSGFYIGRAIQDHDGSIWAAARGIGEGKLCEIRNGRARCYGEKILGSGAFGVHEDRSWNLWVGTAEGVWRWKPGPPTLFRAPERHQTIQDLVDDENGSILIPLSDGVKRIVGGKLQTAYPLPGRIRGLTAGRMLRDRDGGLWIGTSAAGIVHIHRGRTEMFSRQDGLSGDNVSSFLEDREGNVWVATLSGLDRFRELPIVTHTVSQGLTGAPSGAVLATRDGNVWVETAGGLDRLKDGRVVTVYGERVVGTVTGVPSRRMALFEDSQGRIWFSSRSGVGYMENERYVSTAVSGGLINAVTEGANGDMWFSDQELGLFRLSPSGEVQQTPWNSLGPSGAAVSLTGDPSQGGIWAGFFRGGIAWFRDGQVVTSYTPANGLAEGRVNDLRFDAKGTLWVATDGGLSLLKNGRLITLTSRSGLPCDGAHWTIEDAFQSVWFETPCGLARAMRSELDAGNGQTIHAAVFDGSDGLVLRATGAGYAPHVARSSDGKLWFQNGDGLGVVDPRHVPSNQLAPPVHVERVAIDGREVGTTDRLELSRTAKNVEITYTGLSFRDTDRVRFKYKLEGEDADWVDAGTRRVAIYNNLGPRQYRFRVMASNDSGVWNEVGASWTFKVVPAFYQTLWFQALCVVAGLGMLWLLHRLRLRQMTARVNLLYTERLAERTRIARDLHDTLLQSLAGVSLQLDGIAKQVVRAPEKTPSLIARVREQVDACFREARVKVWNLRSPELQVFGLEASLRQLTERIGASTTAGCDMTVSGDPRPVEPDLEEELLRIAQEATNNAVQHAEATQIRIALNYGASSLLLSISDDGRGFDFDEASKKSGHWGLKNMPERAALIGGTCKISSAPGEGTRIEVRVPLAPVSSLRNNRAKHAHSSSGG